MKSVQLYFIPTSFYSQKARLCLEEKGIKYKETTVWLPENEQQQAWYLKINPNGEVPALRVGDQYYSESETIMDIVDELPSDVKQKLVPDSSTPEGKQVAHWRQLFNEVQVPLITFGVAVFREFAHAKPEGMLPSAQGVKDRFEGSLSDLEKLKIKHPEFTEYYDSKIAGVKQRLIDFFDKNKITGVLDDTDAKMAEIEQQLLKMSFASGDSKNFLCGQSFTAADITLCVLLGRFRMLGLLPRFVDPQKYPNLDGYWQRVQKRQSVQKVVMNNVAETKRIAVGRKIRHYGGIAAALGVVGVGVWLAYRHIKK